jgi:deazaflavin-dependent oxidoreductase (nitroreductase family)
LPDPNDHNARIIDEFRANGGRVGGYFDGATMLLLHTKGIKTGRPLVKPLVYLPDGDRFVVFGSKGGAPTDPLWVRNVLADPEPTVELGDRTVPVRAVDTTGPEADELYARQVERRPGFAEYRKKTSRWIPVIALEPRT